MCHIEAEYNPRVWDETTVTARKAHRCSCCHNPIVVGEKYVQHFDVSGDGDANSSKLCGACYQFRAEFAAAHGGVIAHPLGLVYDLYDCIADGDDESERRWLPMVKWIEASRKRNTAEPGTVPVTQRNQT